MKILPRRLSAVFFAVVLWMRISCCVFALTPGPESTGNCKVWRSGLEQEAPQFNLPEPDKTRTRNGYTMEISRIESESGAFTYALVPELVGLGMVEKEAGENADAVRTFRRAFFIVRMHQGLYTTAQIPLLEMMIDSNSNMGHWKKVEDEYDLLYWLYRRNYGDNDPRLLPVLKRLRQWNLNAYNKDTGRTLEYHFRAAAALYDRTLAILKACGVDKELARCYLGEDCCNHGGPDRTDCRAHHS